MKYRGLEILGLLSFFTFMSIALQAQERVVYGYINTFDSIPLPDAQIHVKSTKRIFFTDENGRFTAPVDQKDKLTITARGFLTRKVKIKKNIKAVYVNMQLEPNVTKDVYAVGYGYLFEENKSTATSSLNKNEASFSRYSTIFDMIAGQFPGVEVKNEEIIIRGSNSLNSSNSALLVLDGVIIESDFLKTLRPVQVKDINVLKDGAAAVFGSRGANGVVLIETRKGGDTLK